MNSNYSHQNVVVALCLQFIQAVENFGSLIRKIAIFLSSNGHWDETL